MIVLVKLWIIFALWGALVYSAVFLWAVRNRQFSELDRQRYIAIRAADPIESDDDISRKAGVADRYTWLALVLLALAVIAAGVLLGLKCTPGGC
jgi:cbb3-type cytochrome oxidase maturation protein